jgi:hypothetical protein
MRPKKGEDENEGISQKEIDKIYNGILDHQDLYFWFSVIARENENWAVRFREAQGKEGCFEK